MSTHVRSSISNTESFCTISSQFSVIHACSKIENFAVSIQSFRPNIENFYTIFSHSGLF